jgi:hypothetical protein
MRVNIGKYRKNCTRKISIRIDESDTYNVDVTLSHIIWRLLSRYKKVTLSGWDDMSNNKWKKILKKIINAFKDISEGNYADESTKEGLNLFAIHYFRFWW